MKLTAESTVFNDDKVQEKFAELVVDADGIRTEVGTKVGNNEVISRINQSAESVKIQADKVNIEGAAIFTGSGRLSETSLDNAYDANGTATGAVNTLKNDLSSASGATVINGGHIATNSIGADKIKVDEIEIGAAQIANGTIDTARIPNLSATKITSDTLDGARVNAMGASGGARATLTSTGLDIYNSSNEKKASYGATQYIYGGNGTYPYVAVNGSGAGIYQSNTQKAIMTSAGLLVYSGNATDSVASFGATARVGKLGQKNIQITNTNFNVYDDDGSIPFQVSTATSAKTEQYGMAWYMKANSSYQTQAYFKGVIVNNTVSVGVATSGVPTASNTIALTNLGTEYTITVSGVKYTFTRFTDSLLYKIENTNSAKRSCLVSFTQSYRKTYVRENTHLFDTQYQTVSIEDVTGTCGSISAYTYGGIAQLVLTVYKGSSVSNCGLIYKGNLGNVAPIERCYMAGFVSGVKNVVGYISPEGLVLVYNVSGGSLSTTSSTPAELSATYIMAQ